MKSMNLIAAQLLCVTLFAHSQNVGIGMANPQVRLDVASDASLTARFSGPASMYLSFFENDNYRGYIGSFAGGEPDMDFGTGAGNTTGKVHLTIQAIPRLTIASNGDVGIGTQAPAAKLDVNGVVNLRNALQINGAPGSAGQVLTSNGAASPIWQNAALTNSVRFGVRFQRVGSGGALSVQSTYYNQSPADVTIGATSITINKSGLYRLNGYMTGLVQGTFAEPPEMTVDLNFSGAFALQYDLLQWRPMTKRTAVNINYFDVVPYELDIYLPAGTIINLAASYLADADISYQEANVRMFGYLISE